jgi:Txe/YoeB family toxin of Txe-Axe toxin-antitoxin module
MNRIRRLLAFIRQGPFRGNHKPVKLQFDSHSYQAVGFDAEDRYDVLMSARADREAEIAYWSNR